MKKTKQNKIKPFLRWAGGKTRLLSSIMPYIPETFNNYYEPFIGGGSVYINLKTQDKIEAKSYLSDINKELINAYQILKRHPKELIENLKQFENNQEEYYRIRSLHFDNQIESAARFIYLNRTSFNGIYRENLKGEYNVPYGHKKYNELFDYDNLINLSLLFEKSYFSKSEFNVSGKKPIEGDFVFLDPPYTVAHSNNGFVKYNQKIFKWKDQEKLKILLDIYNKTGVQFIMTNAYHESIISLYDDVGDLYKLERPSLVGGKNAKRQTYNEVLITNC